MDNRLWPVLWTVVLVTGCASSPSGPGRTLSYTSAAGRPSSDDEPPRASEPTTGMAAREPAAPLYRRKAVREEVTGASPVRAAATAGVTRTDAWERLLTQAGLEPRDERPLGDTLTHEQAARLMEVLLGKPLTRSNFPPRMVAGFLLREVLAGGEVSREELLRRVERFAREQVAVLRPDGYLA
jgi:hypothetical protein